MDEQLARDYQKFTEMAAELLHRIEETKPFIERTLVGEEALPEGVLTRGALAAMQFGSVLNLLFDLNDACTALRNDIAEKQ